MEINKNYHISFDISTTNVGIGLWDDEGNLVELKHLELKVDKTIPQEDRYIYKAELFKTYLLELKKKILNQYNGVVDRIFVEAPLSNTPVNINTTAKLLGFNGIACYILYDIFKISPYLISVYQSRKLFNPELIKRTKKRDNTIKETLSFPKDVDKKKYIWEKVSVLYPKVKWFYNRNGNLKKENYDMSDSVVVGISGLLVENIISFDKWEKINNKCVKEINRR